MRGCSVLLSSEATALAAGCVLVLFFAMKFPSFVQKIKIKKSPAPRVVLYFVSLQLILDDSVGSLCEGFSPSSCPPWNSWVWFCTLPFPCN
jgi:hypothetical protein